jgi:small subunit ribosomal protein S15
MELDNRSMRMKKERQELIKSVQRHTGDVGSPEVVASVLTHRIREQAETLQDNRKNFQNMRKLELDVNHRRRLLTYLRESDFLAYSRVIFKLGLNDVFGGVEKDDRYLTGTVHAQKVDDRVQRLRFAFHPQFHVKKGQQWAKLKPKLVTEDPFLASLR